MIREKKKKKEEKLGFSYEFLLIVFLPLKEEKEEIKIHESYNFTSICQKYGKHEEYSHSLASHFGTAEFEFGIYSCPSISDMLSTVATARGGCLKQKNEREIQKTLQLSGQVRPEYLPLLFG